MKNFDRIAIVVAVVAILFGLSGSIWVALQFNDTSKQSLKKESFEKIPFSHDSIHQWEIIGKTDFCNVYYRKHKAIRIYWTLCKNGNSSITCE